MTATEIIRKYTAGETTLEETNTTLERSGSDLRLNPERNSIAPEEADRFGLLDTGTGTLDKVEIQNGRLVNADCGDMMAFCHYRGELYAVKGAELVNG